MVDSVEVLGAYVPGWLLCGILGIVVAGFVRAGLGLAGIADTVLFPLFAYPAFVIFASGTLWLWLF